ncbi:odorant receptor 33b-like [Myzus persicae]|uniref:odorant receptor 33b-like n=1 Tax=Myzus persicae TaxID=13164 RepID=UPI000B939DD1|nr:odorant receptor 33b-like [Myzus persicae]
MEHQAMMEKYEDFLILFRPMILLQIFISSFSVIMLLFTFMMGFSNVEIFESSTFVQTRLFCTILPILIQIFTICYFYGNIHDQKDSILFALYSSNWTEMDMKCKQLILLTMKLNNANHKQLKFTRTKIVNLEMFFKTMGDCYTVISVLVNYIQQNVDQI